jgi:hypothetical protein
MKTFERFPNSRMFARFDVFGDCAYEKLVRTWFGAAQALKSRTVGDPGISRGGDGQLSRSDASQRDSARDLGAALRHLVGIEIPSKSRSPWCLLAVLISFAVYNGIKRVNQLLVDRWAPSAADVWFYVREVYIPSVTAWVLGSLKVAVGLLLPAPASANSSRPPAA